MPRETSRVLRRGRVASASRYLRNRALRILPAYWVILLLCAFVLQSVLVREDGELVARGLFDLDRLLPTALFAQHYAPASVGTGIGPAWSLAVEVVFYLVLPLLALLAWAIGARSPSRSRRRVAALVPVALMLAVGLSGKAAAACMRAHTDGWSS